MYLDRKSKGIKKLAIAIIYQFPLLLPDCLPGKTVQFLVPRINEFIEVN